jgi:ubiquinone/menaquinone biosynthesis C-methylase UbiE
MEPRAGTVVDKHGLLEKLADSTPLNLELGCGSRKRNAGAIGIDAIDYSGVDLVGDVFDVLRLFPSGSVDAVYAYHFIEHVADISLLVAELSRVVKPNGVVELVAPHFSNPYFYSDPTHRSFFGLYTFCYMARNSPFSRQVPTYQSDLLFSIESVDLRFKSARQFYGRYALKLLVGKIFNSCNYLKELYEENFSYLFPCYEVCYRMKRLDAQLG